MDTEFSSCLRLIRALAEVAEKLSQTAQLLSGWKGVQLATHRVSARAEGSDSIITSALEVQTESGALWLWLVEVRCGAEGWAINDHRQGIDDEGHDFATEMPGYQGNTVEDLLTHVERAADNIMRNVDSGWWLRAQPKRTTE